MDSTVVVGAGPAGLTAAYELARRGHPCEIFEADRVVGGISRTEERDGWRFDIGGHRFFTKVPRVENFWNEILGEEDFLLRPRMSRIHYKGRFYDYPLRASNALLNLGVLESLRCVGSYAWARIRPPADQSTFEGWVAARFGRRLYGIFFKTYTEKVWGVPAASIQADWAAQRIRNLSLGKAIADALRPGRNQKEITSLIEEFRYPRLGPGMMWEACADRVRERGSTVHLGTRVERIRRHHGGLAVTVRPDGEGVVHPDGGFRPNSDTGAVRPDRGGTVHPDGGVVRPDGDTGAVRPESGTVHPDGDTGAVRPDSGGSATREVHCDNLISSMPLNALIRAFGPDVPDAVAEAAAGLRYRDFLTVALVVPERFSFPDNWIYIHSPEVRLGRVQNYGSWSPYLVQAGRTCLGLEYFVNEGDDLWRAPDDDLVAFGTRELEHLGLVTPGSVQRGYVVRMPKAYPVYDAGYVGNVEVLRKYLDVEWPEIHPVGRNGMHRYNNQDHSMLTAMLTVENIVDGARHDVWEVNVDAEYHEERADRKRAAKGTGRDAPVLLADTPASA
ncbi:NAD(P)/FAD-dependent oxidoreductase [Streptosporangium sp. NBC_01469]|uniref:NAD(P)/FAD-dependent oxidoreductase n=1 Tax=Streptosporangium sp. NBC_01469 TaxID=2903898 RepID=UPI002E29A268|nr:NAD(P)/FAD-dependent oxidoreductase [Streptosporangium sp. NBC_01469]